MKKTKSLPSFAEWLKSVPSLEDCNEEEITINVPITLSAQTWLTIAHVAAVHNQTERLAAFTQSEFSRRTIYEFQCSTLIFGLGK